MTAEEFFKQMCDDNYLDENGSYSLVDIKTFMIEFAKFHVELALDSAVQNVCLKFTDRYEDTVQIDKDSILNAYPLDIQ